MERAAHPKWREIRPELERQRHVPAREWSREPHRYGAASRRISSAADVSELQVHRFVSQNVRHDAVVRGLGAIDKASKFGGIYA
jgi:hypothetical protein